eukprot:m.226917 g.226917  ORF g.226917 m.226917 type:complete len:78 (+) comp40032_c1_seq8:899-1132(+)
MLRKLVACKVKIQSASMLENWVEERESGAFVSVVPDPLQQSILQPVRKRYLSAMPDVEETKTRKKGRYLPWTLHFKI